MAYEMFSFSRVFGLSDVAKLGIWRFAAGATLRFRLHGAASFVMKRARYAKEASNDRPGGSALISHQCQFMAI